MITEKKFITLVCILICTGVSAAEGVKTTAAQFLRISPSARASAMGNAYSAVPGQSEVMFYNPALLSFISADPGTPPAQYPKFRNFYFNFDYARWLEDMNYFAFSSSFLVNSVGVFGLGITGMNYGTIMETTGDENDYTVTGRELGSGDISVNCSYSRQIFSRVGFGINIKGNFGNLSEQNFSYYAADAGLLFRIKPDVCNLSLVIQNISPSIDSSGTSFPMPVILKAGGSYHFYLQKAAPDLHAFTLSSDLGIGMENEFITSFGIEYGFRKIFFLRSGYQFKGDEPGFKTGLGLHYREFTVNYAYVIIPDLGAIHKAGISYYFLNDAKNIKTNEKKKVLDIEKKKTVRGIEINFSDVIFDHNSADINDDYEPELKKIISIIKVYTNNDFMIEGHTDNTGDDEYNLELSKLRAKKIYDYLKDNDIAEERLLYSGYGKTQPIASNKTKAGRAKNRRVTIIITKKKLSRKELERFDYYYYNGMDYYIKGAYDLALREWEKAQQINPDDQNIKKWIGKAKQQSERRQK